MNCTTGKRSFETENDAIATEKLNRAKFNTEVQYAYRCENCGNFHLTSLPPGTGTMAKSNLDTAGHFVVKRRNREAPSAEVKEKVNQLYSNGRNPAQISREMTLPYHVVRTILGIGKKSDEIKTAGLESLEERKARLLRELQSIEDEKKRFIEYNMIRISQEGAVTVIKKGHESLHLFARELNELIEQLMDRVAA